MRINCTDQHDTIWYIKGIRYKLFHVFTSSDHVCSFIVFALGPLASYGSIKNIHIFKVILHFRSPGNLLHIVCLRWQDCHRQELWQLVYKRAQIKKGKIIILILFVPKFCCHAVKLLDVSLFLRVYISFPP